MAAGGKMPEYAMLTPLALTPEVIPHDYEQLVNMGLALPCDMVSHYSMMNLMPGLTSVSGNSDCIPSRMPTSPDIDDDDDDYRDEEQDHGDSKDKDPFSPKCKIPLPTPFSPYEYWLEPSFIRRRNERERQRVRNVNDGFERLKNHLPIGDKEKDKRLSKVEILRMAIRYIRQLQDMLKEDILDDSKENVVCITDSD